MYYLSRLSVALSRPVVLDLLKRWCSFLEKIEQQQHPVKTTRKFNPKNLIRKNNSTQHSIFPIPFSTTYDETKVTFLPGTHNEKKSNIPFFFFFLYYTTSRKC